MTVLYAPDVADRFTSQLIRRTAKALVADGTYPRSDLDDVIQELRLALIEQAGNFDPERARWSTFVKTVVRLTAHSLRRKQQADFRQEEADIASLNTSIVDGDGRRTEIGATVSEEEYRRGVGMGFVSHVEQVDLALDVQAAIDKLPAELREVCERLKYQSPAEIARELSIPKTSVSRRIAQIREHFLAAGLADES